MNRLSRNSYGSNSDDILPPCSSHNRSPPQAAAQDFTTIKTIKTPLLSIHGFTPSQQSHNEKPDTGCEQRYDAFRPWWQEIAAVILSTIAFVALILTSYLCNDQPLPQWPYMVSVNALVSIYIVIFKSTILFTITEALSQLKWLWFRQQKPLYHMDIYDQASRGPVGSLRLLYVLKNHDYLTSLGAMIIILIVIIDPFTQQLLSYYTCPWPVTNSHTALARTSFLQSLGSGSTSPGYTFSPVPTQWQEVVQKGIFVGAQGVPSVCATGNCSFPHAYSTFGFCSSCTDVSDQLQVTNITQFTQGPTYESWGLSYGLSSGFNVSNRAYRLNGLGVDLGLVNWTGIAANIVADNVEVELILAKPPQFDLVKTSFTDAFSLDSENCLSANSKKDWRCRGYGAARCQIRPCVKTFNASVVAGLLTESLLTTTPDNSWSSQSPYARSTVNVNCISPQERSMLEAANYQISSNQSWLAYDITSSDGTKFDPLSERLFAGGCLYAYDQQMIQSLSSYLRGRFHGSLQSILSTSWDPRMVTGPEFLQQVFNWGNITFDRVSDIFTNITNSMTSVARQTGHSSYSNPVTGIAFKEQTCLRVRWPWLLFPATLLLMAWWFSIGMLLSQHNAKDIPVWKSSTLPMLLNVAITKDSCLSDRSGSNDELAHLDEIANKVHVQLGRSEKGTRLVEGIHPEVH